MLKYAYMITCILINSAISHKFAIGNTFSVLVCVFVFPPLFFVLQIFLVPTASSGYCFWSTAMFFCDSRPPWFIYPAGWAGWSWPRGARQGLYQWIPVCTQSNSRNGRESSWATQNTQVCQTQWD